MATLLSLHNKMVELLPLEERIEHNGRLHTITLQKIDDFHRELYSDESEMNKRQFRKKVHDIRDICLTAMSLGAEHITQQRSLPKKTTDVFADLMHYVGKIDELLDIIDNPEEAIDQDIIPIITEEDISDFYQERYNRVTEYIELLCRNTKEFYSRLLEEINLENLASIGDRIEDLIKDNSSNNYFNTTARMVLAEIDKSINFMKSTLSGEKNPYDHDVFYLVENNVHSAEEIITAHNFQVSMYVSPECGKINIDKSDFDRVLFNLLTNAVKYGRSKDDARTKEISVYAFKTSRKCRNYLTILVADEGIGISSEDDILD